MVDIKPKPSHPKEKQIREKKKKRIGVPTKRRCISPVMKSRNGGEGTKTKFLCDVGKKKRNHDGPPLVGGTGRPPPEVGKGVFFFPAPRPPPSPKRGFNTPKKVKTNTKEKEKPSPPPPPPPGVLPTIIYFPLGPGKRKSKPPPRGSKFL